MTKLLCSQRILDRLIDEGKIKRFINTFMLLSDARPCFEVWPEYRILRTIENNPYPNGLAGQIGYAKDVKRKGGAAFLKSLICRAVAYAIESGFTGEKKQLMSRHSDSDLLALVILKNLSSPHD